MFSIKYYSFVLLVSAFWMISTNSKKVEDFFPNSKHNLTIIKWAHAVNDETFLNKTLNDTNINMIEADVQLNKNNTPVMAHDADTANANLTLEHFLELVNKSDSDRNNSAKGVKLDFKTIEALNASTDILQSYVKDDKFPLWINADILKGPINATDAVPVNATQFFNITSNLTNATLSLGWTTQGGNLNGSYTAYQIGNMTKILNDTEVKQNVTFAVRAGFAAESAHLLHQGLLNNFKNSTLTIWSSKGDAVNVTHLRDLIGMVGVDKVFIDVPQSLLDQLRLDTLPVSSSSRLISTIPLMILAVLFKSIFIGW